jgi:hypothetical protein|eukprot:COSAG06_NODE_1338_length_9815_cov_25.206258_2_plen_50_part_00
MMMLYVDEKHRLPTQARDKRTEHDVKPTGVQLALSVVCVVFQLTGLRGV